MELDDREGKKAEATRADGKQEIQTAMESR